VEKKNYWAAKEIDEKVIISRNFSIIQLVNAIYDIPIILFLSYNKKISIKSAESKLKSHQPTYHCII
jgi:hypothetical protein